MDCAELLATFSDYRDRRLDPDERARIDEHLERCASCRRYRRVVDRGVLALRRLPVQPVPDDFRPRLQHRIFHLEDDEALNRRSSTSGTSGTAAVTMAVLLALAAWGPAIHDEPAAVTLPPIVVEERSAPPAEAGLPASAFFGRSASGPGVGASPALWSPSAASILLLEASYDPLLVGRYSAAYPVWPRLD